MVMQNVRTSKMDLSLVLLESASISHKFHNMLGITIEEMMLRFGGLNMRKKNPNVETPVTMRLK